MIELITILTFLLMLYQLRKDIKESWGQSFDLRHKYWLKPIWWPLKSKIKTLL